MADQHSQLNSLSLFEFPALFARLSPPDQDVLRGYYHGTFVGPAWLRRLSGPLLVMTGLGGWWGKDFNHPGSAINLAVRAGQVIRCFPMKYQTEPSRLDGKPALVLHYSPQNPFPWPWIVDELRTLEPGIILGMTMAPIGPLKRLALPFVLQPQENMDGL